MIQRLTKIGRNHYYNIEVFPPERLCAHCKKKIRRGLIHKDGELFVPNTMVSENKNFNRLDLLHRNCKREFLSNRMMNHDR